MPSEVISHQERELAKEVSDYAMLAGWDKAIQLHAQKHGLSEPQIIMVLNKAEEYNDKAEASGRIDALSDWAKHKQNPEVELAASAARKTKKKPC